jgi:hypothetical protein
MGLNVQLNVLHNISRQVGDEVSSLFWKDPWLDGVSLDVKIHSPVLIGFGFSWISKHWYGTGKGDIGTHPEFIPKPIPNVEN